jgi:superfamily I DNA/RNA helicase
MRGVGRVRARLAAIQTAAPSGTSTVSESTDAAAAQLTSTDELTDAVSELKGLATLWASTSLSEFLDSLALRKEEEEALSPAQVNIMTAHKAKGLDACVVIIAAAEEELFPGRGNIDEERRLFYVSLTRARHALFITHSMTRTGVQQHAGTGGSSHRRTLFLDGLGLVARPGETWIAGYVPSLTLLSPIAVAGPTSSATAPTS